MPPGPPPAPPRVLVVDDEGDILVLLHHLLKFAMPGVDVVTAPSGAEGLAALRAGPADVILSDFRMPGMDGVEFLTASQATSPHARRLLMTAFPELEVQAGRLNAAHLHAVLAKPFEPDEVVAVVEAAVQSGRARRAAV